MKAEITHKDRRYPIDLSKPLDLSIPLQFDAENVSAWAVAPPQSIPLAGQGWVASVREGGAVNCNTLTLNPHGHGTHTECVGHITPERYSVNTALKHFFYLAQVITITPRARETDLVIDRDQMAAHAKALAQVDALVIRTLPNLPEKKTRQYTHSNWPYLTTEAAKYIREAGIAHLLIDLPSVDKENDGGLLKAHCAFWNYPDATRYHTTITEMIYVDPQIPDGRYVLNLQIAAFENDATPSKPILYAIDSEIKTKPR